MYWNATLLVLATGMIAHVAEARLPSGPASQSVTMSYVIFNTPGDSGSGVDWTFDVNLTSEETDGDSIGWRIELLQITDYDSEASPDRVWQHDSPSVDTADGLWWVTHADPTDPQFSEFSDPPFISGLADAQTTGVDDLNYEFAGVSSSAASGLLAMIQIDYKFWLTQPPEREGDDEWAEYEATVPITAP